MHRRPGADLDAHAERPLTVGGLCLEVQDGSTAIGAIAQIDTCTGAPEQTWAFAQA